MYLISNWSFQKSKMPGISAKLEMVHSNDSTKFEPFLYGKKMVQGLRKSAISAPPWQPAPNRIYFKRPAPFFLHYENGSNLVESLLSIIPIYAEFPGIFDFWKDQLIIHSLPNFFKTNKNSYSFSWLIWQSKSLEFGVIFDALKGIKDAIHILCDTTMNGEKLLQLFTQNYLF